MDNIQEAKEIVKEALNKAFDLGDAFNAAIEMGYDSGPNGIDDLKAQLSALIAKTVERIETRMLRIALDDYKEEGA
jgi:hypothetical protein